MSRLILILVVGAFVVYGITNVTINRNITNGTEASLARYNIDQARDIANSVVEMALSKLANDSTWRVTTETKINLLGGSAKYTVVTLTGQNTGESEDDDYSEDNSNGYQGMFGNAGGWSGSSEAEGNSSNNNGHENGNGNGNGNHGNGSNDDDDDGSGSFSYTRVKISATGYFNSVSKHVEVIARFPEADQAVPKFFNYAVLSEQTISMNGNVDITDDNNSSWNANVHTNHDFQMNGNNTIDGFLSYVGNAHSNPSWRMTNQIVPNQNPNDLPNYSQTGRVDIPSFNPDDYKDKAAEVYNGNKYFTSNLTLGTAGSPKIIYVGGDLTIHGNVTGYGVFIVKGNVNISGNVEINASDPDQSNLGFYTNGNINASGNVTIKAQILANQNVNLSGNCKIYGSVTTKGVVNFNGNVNIYYKPANSALTSPFWVGEKKGNKYNTYGFAKKRMIVQDWYE